MFDIALVLHILAQIDEALESIGQRFSAIEKPEEFIDSPAGKEKLDGICMLFMAVGESLKNLDKLTQGNLLADHPQVDWRGVKGFRDVLAHRYFDIDAEQVF